MTADQSSQTPIHPGLFVRKIVEDNGLSVTEAAEVLGLSRTALSAFLNAHASLSTEMALRVEKAFGVTLETLMGMQSSYDIAQARQRPTNINVMRYSPSRATPRRAGAK